MSPDSLEATSLQPEADPQPNSDESTARRILYIHPDTMGFPADHRKNPLWAMSRLMRGDYLSVWWVTSDEEAQRRADRVHEAIPAFRMHWTRSYRLPPVVRHLHDLWFFVARGWTLNRERRYDAIVAYGPYRTALAGYLLKLLTGVPLIVEVTGNPRQTHRFSSGPLSGLKRRVGPAMASFTLRRADHIRILYPGQVDGLAPADPERTSIFHGFVPVSAIPPSPDPGDYVLFLGYPWMLKGVDVLIRAFNRLRDEFPDVRLKVVGHCPDRTPFEALRGDNERIEFHRAVKHDEAMKLMAGCRIFVLPSRTEGMGRVLLEAMAARRPIVASRVDGIPHYVEDGRTGLLFTSEDADELENRLRTLLSDRQYSQRLAEAAETHVRSVLNEDEYARRFAEMVDAVRRRRARAV